MTVAPSRARLTSTIATLAGDEFAGRRVGSSGGRAAGRWLTRQLRALGATVAVEDFTVPRVRELSGTPELEWTDGTTTWRLTHRSDFAEHLASAEIPAARTAGLAPVSTRSGHRWLLAPSISDTPAVDDGVVGLLVPRGVDGNGWLPKMLAGPPAGALPVIAVRPDIHRRMSAAAQTGSARVTASMPIRSVDVTGTNVHGVVRTGTGVRVLLTAHYDGVGDDPGRRLPAAADNASGVAVVLEAARLVSAELPPDAGLSVSLVDGEEVGAAGSAQHARQVPPGTYVINVDGAGRLQEAAAVEAGGPADQLLAALDHAGRATGIPLRGAPVASDNRRYAAAGLPSVGIGMGMVGYHTPADTPDRVDLDTLVAATRLIVATARHIVTPVPSRR